MGDGQDGADRETRCGPTGPHSPDQDALGAADEADQNQQADGNVKQQHAQVAQPPAGVGTGGTGWRGHTAVWAQGTWSGEEGEVQGQARNLDLRPGRAGANCVVPQAVYMGIYGIWMAMVLAVDTPWGIPATVPPIKLRALGAVSWLTLGG